MQPTFVDEVTVQVRSGDGGAGCVAFRREKFVAFGGPSGGDGGCGGDVVARADAQLSTLMALRHRPKQFAEHGAPGAGSDRTGRDGSDRYMRVPVGTILSCADTGALLADLDTPDAEVVVARGGRGGRGNARFKTSVRQAPQFAQPGTPGTMLSVRLELKLMADVGLVGLPNVGKSSLIARISAARPKVANYPFTTLAPHLGAVPFGDDGGFVVADVPGLIAGAHRGLGLGTRFLRHIERVSLVAHVVSVDPNSDRHDVVADYEQVQAEMQEYGQNLNGRPQILVLNKVDLPDAQAQLGRLRDFAQARGIACLAVSAASGAGCRQLVQVLGAAVQQHRRAGAATTTPHPARAHEQAAMLAWTPDSGVECAPPLHVRIAQAP